MRWIVSVPLVVIVSIASSSRTRTADVPILSNENRTSAGTLRGKVLTLRIEARRGSWHPDGDDAPGATVPAFAEEGHAPTIPGPLVRVTAGTEVMVSVRNNLTRDTLVVNGLHDRTVARTLASAAKARIAPGKLETFRFRLDVPGTYYYWGTTTGREVNLRTGEDAQLTGAIVVDSAATPLHDRVFVIGMWTDTVARAYVPRQRILAVVNGRSWPHTERLVYNVGDSVRWRIINASGDNHPLHLHGTYFRVDSRGDGRADTTFGAETAERGVTAPMSPGTTMSISWVPERAGNWLFHCHIPEHFGRRSPLGLPPPTRHDASRDMGDMGDMGMNGLVVGVEIRQRTALPSPRLAATGSARAVRLLIRRNAGGTDSTPFYSFAFQDGAAVPPPDSGLHIGPPLVLVRRQPVSITVLNTTSEPTSVHWHGMEIESYFDGVPGFSGTTQRPAPLIAPGDSFIVRFTPPRAGTFIYHTHVDEERQEPAGLAGPLIVLDSGTAWNPSTDHPVLITSPWSFEEGRTSVLLNGSASPKPIVVRTGVQQRLRVINITTRRPALRLELRHDTTLVAWQPVAKDGADLPSVRRVVRAASQPISIGETLDLVFTPDVPGDLRLDVVLAGVATLVHPVMASLPIRVVGDSRLR
jgi:FtsP/CotA-like multicopper oxidase with cupredoxin domain